ncbi:DUF998 domain-containing protein [Janibacter corallicola]|uniref:DUF998 domain-containing protein n=1 Tax=Janibacter corallicola TaxID=415212 RepID=UPI00082F8624|nr:DUF998 domain-containing protein [Janibacter corallicola]
MPHLLALLAALLLVVRLGILIHLHLSQPRIHPVRQAVSDYALSDGRRWFATMGVVGALVWVCLAVAVGTGLPGWSDRSSVTTQLLVLTASVLAAAALPTDAEGSPRTLTGVLHYAAAIVQFAILYGLTGNFVRLAATDPGLAPFAPILEPLRTVVLVSLIALVVALLPKVRHLFGVPERVFLVSTLAFYLLVAIGLAR